MLIVAWLPTAGLLAAENRLAQETSPYLRLHAHNPVDWYPWGPEALAKAKQEGKVIFLSVGYSSCYWCHVMERESFMDPEIAAFLNEHFVCIKVDREERPDLDSIYMTAVQLITQRGGWPMTVFLTPETKPFYGGTYFPARDGDRGAATGFLSLIKKVHELWQTQQGPLKQSADQLTDAIRENLDHQQPASDAKLTGVLLDRVQARLVEQFDSQYGGFGFDVRDPSRPKFPEPSNLLFLLSRARSGDEKALRIAEATLEKMHAGGIWDHVGGGFHRYSVDRFWRIPHFEKMLYDNGQLVTAYAEAFELTGKPSYRRVVERTLAYVLREMRHAEGGFFSALDAESEKIEGKYYRWTRSEIARILGTDYDLFAEFYGVQDPPNFEHEFHVLQLASSLSEMAAERGQDELAVWSQLEPLHAKLLAEREKRPRPLTDTKVLASWNGLMIRGLADAGRILKNESYTRAAAEAAEFLYVKMRGADGRLFRTYTEGQAKLNAYLDDYAFFADGLIALHRASGDDVWLQRALEITDKQLALFADDKGGFYFTSADHESLIARSKQPTDGAQPAGNSVATQNLIYLSEKRPEFLPLAEKAVRWVVPLVERSPTAAPRMMLALAELLNHEASD